jgi:hypothetical protein
LKINRRLYFIPLLVNVIAVMMAFRMIPEKQVAAVCAGAMFLIFPSIILFLEAKQKRRTSLTCISIYLFFLIFAVPMLGTRIWFWGQDFSTLHIWGLSAPKFHSFSNFGFFGIALAIYLENLFDKFKPNRN